MNFQASSRQLGERAYLVSVAGEVDLYTAPELKRELADVVDLGADTVVVDLSETTFIDSTTLGVLIGAMKRLRSRDGELSLVCSNANIRKIFELTLLDRAFTIYETQAEALDGLGLLEPS